MLEKSQQDIKNPWANIAPTITDGRRIECFSTKQEKDVLNAAKTIGKDWYPVCIIALHTGLRYGSIARMTWNDVDLDKRIIHIKPSNGAIRYRRRTSNHQTDIRMSQRHSQNQRIPIPSTRRALRKPYKGKIQRIEFQGGSECGRDKRELHIPLLAPYRRHPAIQSRSRHRDEEEDTRTHPRSYRIKI